MSQGAGLVSRGRGGGSLKLPARVWHAVFGGLPAVDPPPLSAIAAPTLVVWGDRDEISGAGDQQALASGIPGARLVVYAGTGHAPHWEEPERFARDVVEFASDPTRG